jgi:hypothetical protein
MIRELAALGLTTGSLAARSGGLLPDSRFWYTACSYIGSETSIKHRQQADSSQFDDRSQTILGHMIRRALTIEGALYAPQTVCGQIPSN